MEITRSARSRHVASREYQRAYKACISCRQRKAKCELGVDADGLPLGPPCSRCRREQKQCVFSEKRAWARSKKRGERQLTRTSLSSLSVSHAVCLLSTVCFLNNDHVGVQNWLRLQVTVMDLCPGSCQRRQSMLQASLPTTCSRMHRVSQIQLPAPSRISPAAPLSRRRRRKSDDTRSRPRLV